MDGGCGAGVKRATLEPLGHACHLSIRNTSDMPREAREATRMVRSAEAVVSAQTAPESLADARRRAAS